MFNTFLLILPSLSEVLYLYATKCRDGQGRRRCDGAGERTPEPSRESHQNPNLALSTNSATPA